MRRGALPRAGAPGQAAPSATMGAPQGQAAGARLNDAPRDLRPCHTAQLVLGQAEPVARKVRDVGRLAQVHRQVRQVVQPVAAKDGQVCQAQAGPERDAAGQRVPVDHRLRRPVRARSARPLAR